MFNLGFTEMIILGVIILVFVGPNELPELARMVGRFLNEFRRSTDALKEEWHRSTDDINPHKFMGELKSDIEQTMSGTPEAISAPPSVDEPALEGKADEAPVSEQSADAASTGPSYPPDGKYER